MDDHVVLRLTQRLDHMVPDDDLPASLNAEAAAKLDALSRFLIEALPDASLSPDERLERLARVVQDRTPRGEHLLPAVQKVDRLERRLAELVPGAKLSSMDRLNQLVAKLSEMVPGEGRESIVAKLERLGDKRAGIKPVR
jgi:hypothetical protein